MRNKTNEMNDTFDHSMAHKALFNSEKSSAFPHVARCGVNVAGESNFPLLFGTLNVLK